MSIVYQRFIIMFLILTNLLLFNSKTMAEKWLPVGPEGGNVTALAVHPDRPERLFASVVSNGLFVSNDSGVNWNPVPRFSDQFYFSAISIAPSDKDIVYVRTVGVNKIYRSDDGGLNWSDKSLGLPPYLLLEENLSITINPTNPQHLAIHITDVVYQTVNGGDSWQLIDGPNIDDSDSSISGLAITGADNRIIVSVINTPIDDVFNAEGLYLKSKIDNSWVNISPTNQRGFDGVISGSDGADGELLIAFGVDGLWFSSDLGATWTLKENGLVDCEFHGVACQEEDKGVYIANLAFAPGNAQVLFAHQKQSPSIWKSVDQGDSWSYVNSDRAIQRLIPLSDNNLYLGDASKGVFFSSNAGSSWAIRSNGLKAGSITDVVIHPTIDKQVQIGSFDQGVLETLDNGVNWVAKNTGLKPLSEFFPDNFDNTLTSSIHPTNLWVDQEDPSLRLVYSGFVGLFRSTSAGESWLQITNGLPEFLTVTSIIRSNQENGAIYLASPFNGLYRSTDDGLSWQKTGPTSTDSILGMALNNVGDIYVIARDPLGGGELELQVSTDGGTTFNNITVNTSAQLEGVFSYNGQPAQALSALFVTTAIELDVNLNVTEPGKLLRSLDQGQSWQQMSYTNERGIVNAIEFDPNNLDTIYLGTGLTLVTDGDHLFKSTDNGTNFLTVGSNIEPLDIRRIRVNPNNSNEIYLATYSGGLYKSNLLPLIELDSPSQAAPGTEVSLDASGSSDREGDIATFLWQQTAGSSVTISNETSSIAQFTAPSESTELQFTLTVTDQQGESSQQAFSISINNNQLPVVAISAPEVVNYLDLVTLDASSSSDTDGTIATYAWTQTAGTSVSLDDPTKATVSFNAPNVAGDLAFQLTVTDNDGGEVPKSIMVRVNQPPETTLESSISVSGGDNVAIGVTVNDTDSSIDSIEWTQISGITVSLSSDNDNESGRASVSFTAPSQTTTIVLNLRAVDSDGGVLQKQVSISVTGSVTTPPQVDGNGGGGALMYLSLLLLLLLKSNRTKR